MQIQACYRASHFTQENYRKFEHGRLMETEFHASLPISARAPCNERCVVACHMLKVQTHKIQEWERWRCPQDLRSSKLARISLDPQAFFVQKQQKCVDAVRSVRNVGSLRQAPVFLPPRLPHGLRKLSGFCSSLAKSFRIRNSTKLVTNRTSKGKINTAKSNTIRLVIQHVPLAWGPWPTRKSRRHWIESTHCGQFCLGPPSFVVFESNRLNY